MTTVVGGGGAGVYTTAAAGSGATGFSTTVRSVLTVHADATRAIAASNITYFISRLRNLVVEQERNALTPVARLQE